MTTSDEDGRPPGSGDATGSSPEPTEPPELTVLGRIPSGSNAVFRCADAVGAHWVYKPVMGESPLADFPDGTLAAREVAAAVVSDALGWSLVPETVWATGPGGPGMAQRWIDVAAPSRRYPLRREEHDVSEYTAALDRLRSAQKTPPTAAEGTRRV